MNNHERHPAPPSYRGRELPRPEDELQDQGLGFDVVTLLDRRKLLGAAGLGLLGLGLASCAAPEAGSGASSSQASSGTASASGTTADAATASGSAAGMDGAELTEIPDETAGPYPGDGSNGPDVLEQSGIVRSDLRSSFGESSGTAEGVPMTLELTILDLAAGGGAFKDVAVYVWHCDRDGNYSMYSQAVADQNYLRGVQIANENGVVRYTSIFPACYSGRWPHIHFEVYPDRDSITDHTQAIATSQVALPQSACDAVYATAGYERSVSNLAQVSLDSDNVFGDDAGAHQLGATSGSVADGYSVRLTVPVDTRTEPTGGAAPAGGGQGGAANPPPSN